MGYRIYPEPGRFEVVGSEVFESDLRAADRSITDDLELAVLIDAISRIEYAPINSEYACEVLNMRYETHVLPISIKHDRYAILFVYDIGSSQIVLLGIETNGGTGHFALVERAYRETCRFYELVNPAREPIAFCPD